MFMLVLFFCSIGILLPVQAVTSKNSSRYICYNCDGSCEKITTCDNAVACYSYSVIDVHGLHTYQKGCLDKKDLEYFMCKTKRYGSEKPNSAQYSGFCCHSDLCNNGSFPALIPRISSSTEEESGKNNEVYIIVGVVIGVIVCCGILAFVIKQMDKRRHMSSALGHNNFESFYHDDLHATAAGDSTLKEIFEHSVTSGSGGGLPLLIQRTLSHQIHLKDVIGKGRYGEVWHGAWQGESVAVKIFFSRDEASWARETEIYNTMMLSHDNVLAYKGSDVTSAHSCTQLWLITAYHERGSLYDYLNISTLTHQQTFKLALTAVAGIVHLHTEMRGTNGKPAIAHRDLKSKNILVKRNGTCVIADFGLAVTHTRDSGKTDVPENYRVGTKRYMAPEVLEEKINPLNFECYRNADMYACGLILWEICLRCKTGGMAEDYHVPYYDSVPNDPSFEDMKKVVVVDQQRPVIPNRWSSDNILLAMTKVMRECWHPNPSVRLTSLRVKKTLTKIAASDSKIHLDY